MRQWPTEDLRDLAVEEWRQVLSGCSGDEIAHGLREWQGKWPPNAQEFLQAAKGSREHRTAAYRVFPKSLPAPKADSEIVRAEMEKMRKVLNGVSS